MKNQLSIEETMSLAFLATLFTPVYGEGEGDGEGGGEGDGTGEGEGSGGEGEGSGEGSGAGGEGDGEGSGEGSGGKPTDEEARLLKENMKRKANEKALKEQLEAVQGQLTKMTEVLGDLKPEQVRALVDEKNQAEEQKLRAEGEWDKLKEQLVNQHQQSMEAKDQEIEALQGSLGQLKSQVEELTVGRSFSDSPFISERTTMSPSIARTLFGGHFDVVDGEVVAFDKARGADDRTKLIDDKGDALGFDAALQRLVEGHQDSKHLLRSEAKPGAGSGSRKPAGAKSGGGEGAGGAELTGRARIAANLGNLKKG